MKKATKTRAHTEMLGEYDFSGGVRGKYARRYKAGTNLVLLSPDVAQAFPDAESVNEALRGVLKSFEAVHERPRKSARKRAASKGR